MLISSAGRFGGAAVLHRRSTKSSKKVKKNVESCNQLLAYHIQIREIQHSVEKETTAKSDIICIPRPGRGGAHC